jgi:hypothetical protein
MPADEQFAVHPRAGSRAAMIMETAMDRQARFRHGKTNCGLCGRVWFGDVAYCPYCGRRSASAPTGAGPDAPPAADHVAVASLGALAGTRPGRPGMRWKAWWKPSAGVATVLAVVAIGMQERPTPSSDRAGPPDATRAPAVAPAPAPLPTNTPAAPVRGTSTNTAQAPRAEPIVPRFITELPQQSRAPAPPAPRRSLCSAANEAAGLCNPQ